MTFQEIQTAVSENTFDASLLPSVKLWINERYTWICDLEDWTFMRASANVTVTSGSQTVTSLPTDFAIVNGLIDQFGSPLEKILDPEDFYSRYTGIGNTATGQPEAFTVDGATILVGPTSNVTSAVFRLLYERTVTQLAANGDVPIIPVGYHMALVVGARALGCRMNGMGSEADELDGEFRGSIEAMRAKYLRPTRDRTQQSPAYRPR